MAKTDTNLNLDESRELLRYFIGNPPYLQDNRFRQLVSQFENEDDRPVTADDRMSPAAAGEDVGTLSAADANLAASQVGGANDVDQTAEPVEAAKTPAQQDDSK